MARAASKKQAAQNAMMVKILTYGFLASNLIHILIVFGPWRNRARGLAWPLLRYGVTEAIAAGLGITLVGMARQGDDLGQAGLTSYMFDIIYITWFVHITTALIWSKLWYIYLVIPVYAVYIGYTKVIVPFVFKGQDPIASIFSAMRGQSGAAASSREASASDTAQPQSKRQAKLQKRMDRGDPRVQARQQ